jgi:adenosylhomocysteine nucleosidase
LPQSANVLVVCGLKREAAILVGPGRVTVCGDAATLRARLAEAAQSRLSLAISWGVCGGLDPRLHPGDLILGTEVVSDGRAIRTDVALTSSLARGLASAGTRIAVERMAAAERPALTAGDKAELRHATGAAGVDMESLIAGRFALEQGIPFVIARAVADPADRDLPPLVLKAVDSLGQIDAAALLRELIRSPRQFAGLRAIAFDSRSAFQTLNRCRSLLLRLVLGLSPTDL